MDNDQIKNKSIFEVIMRYFLWCFNYFGITLQLIINYREKI